MPEVRLCKYCKQLLNKETDEYVILARETQRYPEILAHIACEQKRLGAYGFEEWLRGFRWPGRR